MGKRAQSFSRIGVSTLLTCLLAGAATAADWYVDASAPGGGDGSFGSPFQTIQQGLNAAFAGDSVIVRAGTYTLTSTLNFPRSGTASDPITLKAFDGEYVLVERSPAANIYMIQTSRSYLTIEGIVFDGNYGTTNGMLRLDAGGHHQTFRNCEIRRHGNHMMRLDCDDLLMEDCYIHHAVNVLPTADAHCLHSQTGHRHTFRRCEVAYATGDLWQGSRDGQWTDIVFDQCDLHIEPADGDSNGITPGVLITENHLDTKADTGGAWISLNVTVRDSIVRGSRASRVSNGGALNLKDPCQGFVIVGNLIYDNRVAFRLRYPSTDYVIYNNFVYDNDVAFRLEDGISGLDIFNNTFYDNAQSVREDGAAPGSLIFQNNIFVLSLSQASNNWWGTYTNNLFSQVGVGWSDPNAVVADPLFVDRGTFNLHLTADSPAIDAGMTILEVSDDFDGTIRPTGMAYDLGADEYQPSLAASEPPADGTLPKTQNNVIALTFDGPIGLPPAGPALSIVPIAGGPDLGSDFAYTKEPDGQTLKAVEAGTALADRTWYRVTPATGFEVDPFVLDLCTLVGDANDSGRVTTADYSVVKAHMGELTEARCDLNGSGRVTTADYSVVKSSLGNRMPVKP